MLSTLYEEVSERGIACAFVAGLSEHARKLLRSTFRMDAQDVNQLSDRPRAIAEDDTPAAELNVAAAKTEQLGNTLDF